jgi:hypothetical protein
MNNLPQIDTENDFGLIIAFRKKTWFERVKEFFGIKPKILTLRFTGKGGRTIGWASGVMTEKGDYRENDNS